MRPGIDMLVYPCHSAGAGFAVALASWARGNALRTGTPYQITVDLPLACGITVGTPLRIRGVQVCQGERVQLDRQG